MSRFASECTLVSNVDAVDPTLLFYKNRWWLFCTRADKPSTDLYIYFADDLKGPFREHGNNPVKTDIRSARPAGKIFEFGEKLIRPAQHSARHYGTHIELFRIVELSEQAYREEYFKSIYPDKRSAYRKGLHTINGLGDYTFIDGKRFVFNWPNFMNRIKEKTVNLFTRR